jgi:hypothetical protein
MARSGQPAAGRRLTAGGQLLASRCASQSAPCRSQLTSSDSRGSVPATPSATSRSDRRTHARLGLVTRLLTDRSANQHPNGQWR